MHHRKSLLLFLALGVLLTLTACLGGGATSIQEIQSCFSNLSASDVHAVGSSISFTVTTAHHTSTYSIPRSAFGGSPSRLRDGDIITSCADQVNIGGHVTTTITQFSDQGQPTATSTPRSR